MMTKEEVKEKLKESPDQVVGALLHIFSYQTADEQNTYSTNEQNNVGFNMIDAGIMTDMVQGKFGYLTRGYLTDKQINFLRGKLITYHRQLANGWEPQSNGNGKPQQPKEEIKPTMTADLIDNTIEIRFQFPKGDDRFSECLSNVKSLSSRKWQPDKKCWSAMLCIDNAEKIEQWGFELNRALKQWLEEHRPPDEIPFIIPDGMKGDPYPFQQQGICWVEAKNGRAIIGDEMGLGKTLQAIGWLILHPEIRPAVIICPAFLKRNWVKECHKWMPDSMTNNIQMLDGRPKADSNITGDIVVVNYDIISHQYKKQKNAYGKMEKTLEIKNHGWQDIIKNADPQAIICDEFHYIKENKTDRTKATKAICSDAPHIIMLSGTPIINRPIEFFNGLNIVMPELFPSFWRYAQTYCGAHHNGYGWDFKGATNTKELHDILSKHVMIRRKKSEVLKDLPEKQFTILPLEITNRRNYNHAESDIISWINQNVDKEAAKKASKAEALVQFEKLKQLAVKGKLDAAIDWVANFIEEEKLVLFIEHHHVAETLMKKFKKVAVEVTGRSGSLKKKDEAVEKFQNDPNCKLFIGSRSAIEGLTLTAASNVAFLELWWSPGKHQQASDRVHRIGQEANSVMVWYLIAENTIEEELADMLDQKAKVLSAVLDGEDVEQESMLTELINKYKET